MEPISTASGPHETPSDRGKNLCVRRLASSDLLFRYVEEVSDLIAARIRRCHKFELEASSPSPLIGTISTSRKLPLFFRFSRSRVVLESLFVLAVGQMCPFQPKVEIPFSSGGRRSGIYNHRGQAQRPRQVLSSGDELPGLPR